MRNKIVLLAAGAVVLAVVVLVALPRSGGTHQVVADSPRYSFTVSAQPLKAGVNSIDIEVSDRAGNPVTGTVTVEPAMPRMGHALSPVTATPGAPGRYRVEAVDLAMAGQWELTVVLDNERVTVPLLLN